MLLLKSASMTRDILRTLRRALLMRDITMATICMKLVNRILKNLVMQTVAQQVAVVWLWLSIFPYLICTDVPETPRIKQSIIVQA